MLSKIYSWFENRINAYPDATPKTPDNGLLRFIWSNLEGMKGWILLLSVLTIGMGIIAAVLLQFIAVVIQVPVRVFLTCGNLKQPAV